MKRNERKNVMPKLSRLAKAGLVLLVLSGTLASVQQGTALANTREPGESALPLANPPKPYYVAIGDSYAAGDGLAPYYTGTNTKPDSWRRSPNSFATQLKLPGQTETIAQEAASGKATFKFVACSGAESTGIPKAAVYAPGTAIYANNAAEKVLDDRHTTDWGQVQSAAAAEGLQVNGEPHNTDALNKDTTLVTIMIGGNDVRFADVLKACVLKNCAADGFTMTRGNNVKDPDPLAVMEPKVISLLKAHLEATFVAIHAAAPNATILVAGYPLFFSGNPPNKP